VYMREVARWAEAPVINLQCDVDHPTQTLADLMTLRERRGTDLRGLRVAVSWAYAPSYAKPLSVPQGLCSLLPRFGIDVVLAYPEGWDLMPELMERASKAAAEGGGSITIVHDMAEAFRDADAVYPKSWGRLDLFTDERAALDASAPHRGWICDAGRMALAKDDALYLHCLPADRGSEVTDDVIDGPQSVVYDEAENRLHTGKALLALTMGGFAQAVTRDP
jgi:ornithine carbamoyltransferase